MVLTTLINKILKKDKKPEHPEFGKFHCPIGDIEAEIVQAPSYEEREEYYSKLRYTQIGNGPHVDEVINRLGVDVIRAFTRLHNFQDENNFQGYLVVCPKMNMEYKDDGGCYCVTTDVPGTCLASKNTERSIGEYEYLFCPYLPNLNPLIPEEVASLPDKKE